MEPFLSLAFSLKTHVRNRQYILFLRHKSDPFCRPVIRAVTRRPAPQLEGLLPPLPEEEPDLGSSCDTPPQDEIPVDGLTGDQRYMDKMAVDGGPHQEWMEEGNLDSPPPSSNLCPAPTVQNGS